MPRQDRSLLTLVALTTERLDLRPLQPIDAEAFRVMTDEASITGVVADLPSPFTAADANRLIVGQGDGRDGFWGLWPRDEPALAGTIGTHLVGDGEIEIGYWLASAWRGRGLASEALAAVLAALANAYPHRRIFAECRPQNVASWQLLERQGFAPDGTDGKRDGRKRLTYTDSSVANRA